MEQCQAVFRLDGREKWDAILVWQARETGYAVSQISSRLRAPFIFRQITAWRWHVGRGPEEVFGRRQWYRVVAAFGLARVFEPALRSEEHTSELQSQSNLVCRLLLEKKH